MTLFRRLLVLAAVAAGAGALAHPSFADNPRPAGWLPNTLTSDHFAVHYQSDFTDTTLGLYAITATTAGDIASFAEQAYAQDLADGYPAPPSDGVLGGDGRIDIYVDDLGSDGLLGLTWPDLDPAATSSAFIELNGEFTQAVDRHTVAHELFHVFQLGVWIPGAVTDYWLLEATAEWMGFRADGYVGGDAFALGLPDVSLDCRDPNGTYMCDSSGAYLNGGYEKWPFFEYLTERFGASFVENVLTQGAAGAGTATQALAAALAAKGTTLASAFNFWSVVDLMGAYTPKLLKSPVRAPYTTVQTGDKSALVASTTVSVNHLASRYIEFDRGTGDQTKLCHPATLAISVTFPAGTSSQPAFWWNDGTAHAVGTQVYLSVNGGTARANIPWDTCTWTSGAGFLVLPNASTDVDAAKFVVTASMMVDTATPASAVAPPGQVPTNTPVVPVTATETAPVLDAFGPELLQLDSGEKTVRLIVQANAEGSVVATIGSVTLGTAAIRPGANDVRFALPASLLVSLRRSAATNTLVLTPISQGGHVQGAPVLRSISIAPAKPAKKHAKKKPRHHK